MECLCVLLQSLLQSLFSLSIATPAVSVCMNVFFHFFPFSLWYSFTSSVCFPKPKLQGVFWQSKCTRKANYSPDPHPDHPAPPQLCTVSTLLQDSSAVRPEFKQAVCPGEQPEEAGASSCTWPCANLVLAKAREVCSRTSVLATSPTDLTASSPKSRNIKGVARGRDFLKHQSPPSNVY